MADPVAAGGPVASSPAPGALGDSVSPHVFPVQAEDVVVPNPIDQTSPPEGDFTPIGQVRRRHRARVHGTVRTLRVRHWADVPSLEAVVEDDTGHVTIVFLGRRKVGGITLGDPLAVEGMVGVNRDRLVILNPAYDLRG